jgi:hypothetical protein
VPILEENYKLATLAHSLIDSSNEIALNDRQCTVKTLKGASGALSNLILTASLTYTLKTEINQAKWTENGILLSLA